MAEVNLSLRFQATNTSAINEVLEGLQKIESKTLKKFKIQLDSEEFIKNLTALKSAIGRLGLDNGLVSNINSVSKALSGISTNKIDTNKIKDFVDSLKSINVSELKQLAGNLNSLGNSLNKLTGTKPPSMTAFINSIKKLAESNVDLKKIENILLTMEHFKSITFEMKGLSDFKDIIKVINNLNKIGIDENVLNKFKKVLEIFNGIKTDINMSGISSIPTMIKNMEGLDKIKVNEQDFLNKMQVIQKGLNILSKTVVDNDKSKSISDMMKGFSGLKGLEALERIKLDEKKFLAKMQTIRKGFEELSQAKIDINKIKSMAEMMNGISSSSKNIGNEGGFGMGGILGSILSISAVNTQIEAAKDLEYAILQVGVAGELSSNQMADVKNKMFDFSRDSGKNALEITQAMDAIIKTGQSLSDSSLILETSVKTAVAAGKVFALYDSNIISKVA